MCLREHVLAALYGADVSRVVAVRGTQGIGKTELIRKTVSLVCERRNINGVERAYECTCAMVGRRSTLFALARRCPVKCVFAPPRSLVCPRGNACSWRCPYHPLRAFLRPLPSSMRTARTPWSVEAGVALTCHELANPVETCCCDPSSWC